MDLSTNINKEVTKIDLLLDTNVLIYIGNKQIDMDTFRNAPTPAISVITQIELLGKKNITQQEIGTVHKLLDGFRLIEFNDKIKWITVKIKQKQIVKTPDAIIAATAILYDMTLLTADVKLAKIQGLKTILVKPIIDNKQIIEEKN